MQKFVMLFVAALLLSSCGNDDLKGFYSFDILESPDGQALKQAEKDCQTQGLRFQADHQVDSASESEVEMERPFLTHSGRMLALKAYVERARNLQEAFGSKVPEEIAARERSSLLKMSELSKKILEKDTQGKGGIATNQKESLAFLEQGLELMGLEQKLSARGISFRVVLTGPNRAEVDVAPGTDAKAAEVQDLLKQYQEKSKAFLERFSHDMASPLIRMKKDLLSGL